MRSPSVPPELLFPLWLGTMLLANFDDRALALNPSLALAWLLSGWVRVWLGEFEEVADRISRSLRLNPADLHSYSMHSALAFAHSLLAAIPRLCLGRKWLCERNPPIFLQLA